MEEKLFDGEEDADEKLFDDVDEKLLRDDEDELPRDDENDFAHTILVQNKSTTKRHRIFFIHFTCNKLKYSVSDNTVVPAACAFFTFAEPTFSPLTR